MIIIVFAVALSALIAWMVSRSKSADPVIVPPVPRREPDEISTAWSALDDRQLERLLIRSAPRDPGPPPHPSGAAESTEDSS